jgi:hypothetical protein
MIPRMPRFWLMLVLAVLFTVLLLLPFVIPVIVFDPFRGEGLLGIVAGGFWGIVAGEIGTDLGFLLARRIDRDRL